MTPITHCNSSHVGALLSWVTLTLELLENRNAICVPCNAEFEDAAIAHRNSQSGLLRLQCQAHGRILQRHAAGRRSGDLSILATYRHNPVGSVGRSRECAMNLLGTLRSGHDSQMPQKHGCMPKLKAPHQCKCTHTDVCPSPAQCSPSV